jgi:hypothetical protein
VAWRIESGSAAGSVYGAPIPALQVAPQDWLPSIYDINSKLIYCQQFGVLSVREWLSRNAIPPSAWGSGFLT